MNREKKMPTLILSCRYTDDSQLLWKAAAELGWDTHRLVGWRLPEWTIEDPVVFVESLWSPIIGKQLGLALKEPPEDWMEKLPYDYGKRLVALMQAKVYREEVPASEFFVKPPNDKSFPAKVYKELPDYIPDDAPILAQEIVGWEKEFRCFMLDGKVKTLSVYCRNGRVQKSEDWYSTPKERQDALEFAEKVAETVPMPRAVVMDVGVIEGRGWAVVELNAAWGSGIYGCDPKQVLLVVKECMEKADVAKV
jgi:hypothetical protein